MFHCQSLSHLVKLLWMRWDWAVLSHPWNYHKHFLHSWRLMRGRTSNHWLGSQSPVSSSFPPAAVLCAPSLVQSGSVLALFPTLNDPWSRHYHDGPLTSILCTRSLICSWSSSRSLIGSRSSLRSSELWSPDPDWLVSLESCQDQGELEGGRNWNFKI